MRRLEVIRPSPLTGAMVFYIFERRMNMVEKVREYLATLSEDEKRMLMNLGAKAAVLAMMLTAKKRFPLGLVVIHF